MVKVILGITDLSNYKNAWNLNLGLLFFLLFLFLSFLFLLVLFESFLSLVRFVGVCLLFVCLFLGAHLFVALPTLVLAEPPVVKKTKLTPTIEITLWTKRWEFKNGNVALGQFINYFKVFIPSCLFILFHFLRENSI